ncbi:hypothetical protein [Streptomyces sp. NPDC058145]|uniref:hypothetical protein n=1 Tax=Streptomyces sp. NPDC058145 TaxID=3346356 RepID=UPI0036E7F8F5
MSGTFTSSPARALARRLPLLGKIPALAGVLGCRRHWPQMLFADRSYDHDEYRRLFRQRGRRLVMAERGRQHGTGLGTFRSRIERKISWLHVLRRLRIRWQRHRRRPRRVRHG